MTSATLEFVPSAATPAEPRIRRVCLVTEAAGGGVGRHFLDLADGLAQRGIEVVGIYSPGRCDTLFRERKRSLAGVRLVELPMQRSVRPGDMIDLARLIRCLRRHGPFDVVHGHSSKGGALARLAARWLKLPAVYTPHAFVTLDPTLSRFKRAVYGQLERWLARQTAGIIAVSEDEAQHARMLGIDARLMHVVPNGVAPPDFPARDEARRRLGLAMDDVAIGFVGRLASQKAPDVLLEAFARVARHAPFARLVLVGSGPLETTLRRRVDQLGLQGRIQFVGDQVAIPFIPAFDLFCLPSRYEGMTYVLLEALAAGLPIVATRVGGVSLCIEQGKNGLIVEPENPISLAEALLRLVLEPDTRRHFAEAAAASAERFTLDHMIAATLEIYASLARRAPAS